MTKYWADLKLPHENVCAVSPSTPRLRSLEQLVNYAYTGSRERFREASAPIARRPQPKLRVEMTRGRDNHRSNPALKSDRQTGLGVEIRPVASRRDLEAFVDLPWSIYARDPLWVPPLRMEVKSFLDRRHQPFYRHGDATQFLAARDGKVVGRILVSDDPRYNQEHQANVGCFGMYESVDDLAVAAALLNAAAAWLHARGRTSIMGPIDYSTNYACGLLIDGFDTPPRVLMNHHRPYYARLLESWGLAKVRDLYAWWFVDPHDMLARWRGLAEKLARRSGVTVRPISFGGDFEADVARCLEVYNASWEKSWGFVKMTDEEFHHLAGRLKQLASEDLILLAEVEGRPVGFSLTLPDSNEALRPLNGRLTRWGLPIGLAKYLYYSRRIKTARMAVLGMLEPYRRRGISELLILRTLDVGKNKLGYNSAELSWTLEDNDLINRTIEKVGGQRYKTYRIYERSIA